MNQALKTIELRTGIWYEDRPLRLTFPDRWDVITHWPDTPRPLTDDQIRQGIRSPFGQQPLQSLAQGKKAPLIITDDLTRPTPVFRIMPFLLEELRSAGIPAAGIRILVATGTHGDQDRRALANKLGKEAVESCRIMIHDDLRNTAYVGKTSFKTPVYVNKEVLKSDLIIGIGGVYPQHTVGFGGGAKLALGVLGRKSIAHLHFGHTGVGGAYVIDNDFRKDVTEISRMIGLHTIITAHINAHLEIVNILCGDHIGYYPEAANFSLHRYTAPLPDDLDVVIANAYPFDSSFTFMRKAYKPLDCAPEQSMRIMIASNGGGIGAHGLFQHIRPTRFMRYRALLRRISTMGTREILAKIARRLLSRPRPQRQAPARNYALPRNADHLWVYCPDHAPGSVSAIDGMTVTSSWNDILDAVERRNSSRNEKIKVGLYPCAALQCLNAFPDLDADGDHAVT
jgi:nickel-dependent lactate racemase